MHLRCDYAYIRNCECIHIYIGTHMSAHTHTNTHIHIHTHAHTRTGLQFVINDEKRFIKFSFCIKILWIFYEISLLNGQVYLDYFPVSEIRFVTNRWTIQAKKIDKNES